MPTFDPIVLEFIEQDDEYMYFEVFELNEDKLKYESRGTVSMTKVKEGEEKE